jgi:hypothetical protein
MRRQVPDLARFFCVILSEAKDLARASARRIGTSIGYANLASPKRKQRDTFQTSTLKQRDPLLASPYPRRGRRDSYRDGRGSTAAHSRCLFLHSGNSSLRYVKPLPNPLLGQGEGTITQRKQAGDNGAGLLTQVQGLAPAFDNTFLIGGKSKIRFVV